VIANDTRLSNQPVTTLKGVTVLHKLYAGVREVPGSRMIAILFEVNDIHAYDKREFLYRREKLSTRKDSSMYLNRESLTDSSFLSDKDDI
jgi:hypothetical protein